MTLRREVRKPRVRLNHGYRRFMIALNSPRRDCESSIFARASLKLRRLLPRDPGPLLARFRETDGDGLLAALHFSTVAVFARA